MQDWEKDPQLIIESGKGCILTDIRGKRYIDGVSSLWVTVHGHRKKEIDAAVARQLKKIAHSTLLGLSNVPAVLLAEKLVSIAPRGLSKVFYSDSGSTAVEIALKIAFQYWQQKGPPVHRKTGFISLTESYHGDTIGSVSVGGIDLFHEIYKPLLFTTCKIRLAALLPLHLWQDLSGLRPVLRGTGRPGDPEILLMRPQLSSSNRWSRARQACSCSRRDI